MSSSVVEEQMLFHGTVTEHLDLPGLMFVAENVTDHLITQRKEKGNV